MAMHLMDDDETVNLRFEITDIVQEEIGFHEQFASQIADALIRGFRKRFCGQKIYISNTDAQDITKRNAGIKKEFNGTKASLDVVMRKYNVSKTTVYRVCNKKILSVK
jgi:Mor family transcriptional regulator